jgi:hypothetical protein
MGQTLWRRGVGRAAETMGVVFPSCPEAVRRGLRMFLELVVVIPLVGPKACIEYDERLHSFKLERFIGSFVRWSSFRLPISFG